MGSLTKQLCWLPLILSASTFHFAVIFIKNIGRKDRHVVCREQPSISHFAHAFPYCNYSVNSVWLRG
ncbi:hypothetical protein EUGRSUZ_E02180 [Eucalyptus grandis]|uniref:Uncharacterized protein n=2 Tax=Eucalyptus grandis TaxID=71139 RepID=A0A059C563_EUCGR|nr:hypothetical protein EUGRSUZ_E02180 [Eucalyptus grandis]